MGKRWLPVVYVVILLGGARVSGAVLVPAAPRRTSCRCLSHNRYRIGCVPASATRLGGTEKGKCAGNSKWKLVVRFLMRASHALVNITWARTSQPCEAKQDGHRHAPWPSCLDQPAVNSGRPTVRKLRRSLRAHDRLSHGAVVTHVAVVFCIDDSDDHWRNDRLTPAVILPRGDRSAGV